MLAFFMLYGVPFSFFDIFSGMQCSEQAVVEEIKPLILSSSSIVVCGWCGRSGMQSICGSELLPETVESPTLRAVRGVHVCTRHSESPSLEQMVVESKESKSGPESQWQLIELRCRSETR